ncbi:MAG TPA: hypothetical protein VMM18_16425 [Gemmatimonadaceae bacterium]|nr:hypothetical protein [Gemmatimonadaceae bacterium]
MQRVVVGAANVAGMAVDCITSAAAAAWPRSVANGEVERLAGDGHEPGAVCDFGFVLALDPDDPDATLRAVRAAGFTIDYDPRRDRGYATVRSTLPLRAFHLSWTLTRLDRVARRNGGFAEMLGPVSGSVSVGRLRDPAAAGALRTNP